MNKKHIWTDEEKNYLINNYENKDISKDEMMVYLGVNLKQLDYQANQILKLYRKGPITKRFKFTKKHEDYLKRSYENPNVSVEKIAKHIGADDVNIVIRKAFKMGLRRKVLDWTYKDVQKVITSYSTGNTMKIAADLGKTPTAVTRMANKNGVKKTMFKNGVYTLKKAKCTKQRDTWTKDEGLLIEIFESKDLKHLSRIFKKTTGAIEAKLMRMDINEKRLKVYKGGQIEFLYNNKSEIAEKLDYCDFWIKAARSKKMVGGFSHARLINLEERTRTA